MSTNPGMSAEVLARNLVLADALDVWVKRIRAEALQRAVSGEHIPGYKLVNKRNTRSWPAAEDDRTAYAQFVSALDGAKNKARVEVSDVWDSRPRSPAQIQKVLPKNVWTDLLPFIILKTSGVDLAPDADPRAAVPPPTGVDFAGEDDNSRT